jgi:hypothetical protein
MELRVGVRVFPQARSLQEASSAYDAAGEGARAEAAEVLTAAIAEVKEAFARKGS